MAEAGSLVYRCRRCSALDRSINVPNIQMAPIFITTNNVAVMSALWSGVPPALILTHRCSNPEGGFGLMDLIGGEPDREET